MRHSGSNRYSNDGSWLLKGQEDRSSITELKIGLLRKDIKATVVEIDNTSVKGRVSAYVERRYIAQERENERYGPVVKGMVHAGWTTIRGYQGIKGVKRDLENIINMKCATQESLNQYIRECIETQTYPGFREVVDYLREEFGIPVFISTSGMENAARAAVEAYKAKDGIGNRLIWDIEPSGVGERGLVSNKEKLVNMEITIAGAGKYHRTQEMLIRHGIITGRFQKLPILTIGYGDDDRLLMMMSNFTLASPQANIEDLSYHTISSPTCAAISLIPPVEKGGYERFLEDLKKE